MLHPLQEIRDDLLVHVDSGRGTAGPELGSGCRFAGRGIGRCGIGGGIVGHDRLFFGCRGSVFGVWRWDGGLGKFFFSWVSSRFQSGFRWVMTFEFGGGMYWV